VTLQTPLCELLGIEHPILSAGMSAVSGPELAAAVSNAGGLGVLGAAGNSPDAVRRRMQRTRELTAKPFGINFIIDVATGMDLPALRAEVEAAAAEHAAAIVLVGGDPAPFAQIAHDAGSLLFVQVGSVDDAVAFAAAGVDALIAQGVEAGGHVLGTTSIWELLPAVVRAVAPLPVIASGGIGDGAGLARALRSGAQAVSLGTRFIASDEASAHPAYKRRVVESTAADTVYARDLFDIGWPGTPHRMLRNRIVREWEAAGRPAPGHRPGEGTSIGRVASRSGDGEEVQRYSSMVVTPAFEGDIDEAPLWAGESCSVVNDIKPAADIVRDLVRDAGAALA
jgi:nitronate monooxygenase